MFADEMRRQEWTDRVALWRQQEDAEDAERRKKCAQLAAELERAHWHSESDSELDDDWAAADCARVDLRQRMKSQLGDRVTGRSQQTRKAKRDRDRIESRRIISQVFFTRTFCACGLTADRRPHSASSPASQSR
jgi:hypothetical protein